MVPLSIVPFSQSNGLFAFAFRRFSSTNESKSCGMKRKLETEMVNRRMSKFCNQKCLDLRQKNNRNSKEKTVRYFKLKKFFFFSNEIKTFLVNSVLINTNYKQKFLNVIFLKYK